jgi:ABC-type phosphate transport system substrate-binding protein
MARRIIVALTIVSLGAGLAGCGGDDAEPAATTTTTRPVTTTAWFNGSEIITACGDVLNEAWAEAARTEDQGAAMDAAGEAGAFDEACGFFLHPDLASGDLGLSIDQILGQLESELDPELYSWLTEPVPVPFDHTADHL